MGCPVYFWVPVLSLTHCIEFMHTGKRRWGGCWFIIDFIVSRKWSVWRKRLSTQRHFSLTYLFDFFLLFLFYLLLFPMFIVRLSTTLYDYPHWNLINFNYVLSKNFPVVEWKCTLKFEWQTLSKRLMTNDLRNLVESWLILYVIAVVRSCMYVCIHAQFNSDILICCFNITDFWRRIAFVQWSECSKL